MLDAAPLRAYTIPHWGASKLPVVMQDVLGEIEDPEVRELLTGAKRFDDRIVLTLKC